MTNEAVKVELFGQNNDGQPVRYTCAAGTAITKGTLMALTDPRTAIAASTVGQPIAGIAAADKTTTDGATTIACWTDGIFELKASGAITIGNWVYSSSDANYPNTVHTTYAKTNAASGAEIIGFALETATDAETINVRIRI